MTDSSDPTAPKSSRKKHARQPATIDVKPTVVDDGKRPAGTAPPAERATPSAGNTPPAPVPPSADTLAGTDSVTLPGAASSDGLAAADATRRDPLSDDAAGETLTGSGAASDKTLVDTTLAGATSADAVSSDTTLSDTTLADTTLSENATLDGPSGPASVDAATGVDSIASDTSFGTVPPAGPTAEAPQSGGRFGQLVAAGLVGGLLGGGIVLGVQALVPFAHEDRRIDALEQRISGLPADGSGALAGRVTALERGRTEQRDLLRELRTGLTQAQTALQEVRDRPAPAAGAPQDSQALTDLASRLAALESGLQGGAQASQEATQAASQAASQALDAAQAVDRKLTEQSGQLAGRLEAQGQQIGALDQRLNQQFSQWDGRLSGFDQRLGQQDARIGGFEQRIGQQDGRLADLARQAQEGASNATRAGVAVTLSERLGDALRSGTPYGDLLEALRKVGTDGSRLTPLEPFATSGAPTAAKLAEGFKPVGETIIRDSRSGAEGWNDRLLRMVDRVVTVRPVDQPGDTSAPGIVARIGEALERGDVKAALAAWETLPEPARRLSEDWARGARARVAADNAADAIASDALAALNRTVQ